MARSKLLPLAEGQLEIMEILWERGEATVGEVWKVAVRTPPGRPQHGANGAATAHGSRLAAQPDGRPRPPLSGRRPAPGHAARPAPAVRGRRVRRLNRGAAGVLARPAQGVAGRGGADPGLDRPGGEEKTMIDFLAWFDLGDATALGAAVVLLQITAVIALAAAAARWLARRGGATPFGSPPSAACWPVRSSPSWRGGWAWRC